MYLVHKTYHLLAFLFLTLLIACSDKKEKEQEVFLMNMSASSLESTDPAFAKDLYSMWAVHMLYNTLVETDENLHLQPSLAKGWTVSDDGLTYTFNLRGDVYFHDDLVFTDGKGRKLTASDVVYSFNRIIDPQVASSGAWIFNDRVAKGKPFVAVNDSTFQVRLLRPFRPLPEILSMPYCSVVPCEAVEKWGKDFRAHPCGSGPFQFSNWDESNVMILHKNDNYWEYDSKGVQLPYVDAVKITFIVSRATEYFQFLQGNLDFVNGVDGSFKDLVLTKKGNLKREFEDKVNLHKGTYLNTEYLGFLTDTSSSLLRYSPVRNYLIRQAINYAIDREKIVTYFRNGIGIPAYSGFIPEGMPGYDTSRSYGYDYNPEKSLELLEQAGFPNGQGLPAITVLTRDDYADIVNFVASQLKDVGIPVQVEILQSNILRQQMSRSEAVFFRAMWIADYPDAETYLAFFNGNMPAPPNYTRFNDATFNKWYDEAMIADNDTIRWDLYRKMDSLAIRQAPLVPLFYDQLLHFTSKRVSGFTSTPMNLIDLKRVKLEN